MPVARKARTSVGKPFLVRAGQIAEVLAQVRQHRVKGGGIDRRRGVVVDVDGFRRHKRAFASLQASAIILFTVFRPVVERIYHGL